MANQDLITAFRDYFANGGEFKNIVPARTMARNVLGLKEKIDRTHPLSKNVDESIEAAVLEVARQIVSVSATAGEAYDRLIELHERQPILSVRSSRSMFLQAYSTPIPLAYAATCLAGIDESITVYDPTAGHGALLLGADPAKVWANELSPDRVSELQKLYPNVSCADAMLVGEVPAVDVVIANPPFGTVRLEGQLQRWQIGTYQSTQIDHAIAWESLKNLKDEGRGVLILGAPLAAKLARNAAELCEAYATPDKVFFYQTLLRDYNVTAHYQIHGDLYHKQGTDFPVDMVVIEGRGQSKRSPPSLQAPERIQSFDGLKQVFDNDRRIHIAAGLDSTRSSSANGYQPEPNNNSVSASLPGAVGVSVSAAGEFGDSDKRVQVYSQISAEFSERDGNGLRTGIRGSGSSMGNSILLSDNDIPGGTGEIGLPASRGNLPRGLPADDNRAENSLGGAGSNGLDEFDRGSESDLRLEEKPMAINNSNQVDYIPQSTAKALGTLIPQNIAGQTAAALQSLESTEGSIDDFVARNLDWPVDHVRSVLSGEQVDAVALAIRNLSEESALILGDQTGNGKGRVLAAMMRYAQVNDLLPIFITEKKGLYEDILRDCSDIEVSLNPLPTDTTLNLTHPSLRISRNDNQPGVWNEILATGALPQGRDAVFSTYTQLQTLKGETTTRREAIRALAPRSILILDESHNAGGSEAQRQTNPQALNRADFTRMLVARSRGVVYSSATYAKNTKTLDLYVDKTPLSRVIDSPGGLYKLIEEGGIPLQQVVTSALSEAGLYLRRERSFEGIDFKTVELNVDVEIADSISASMQAIAQFDIGKSVAMKAMRKAMKAAGQFQERDNAVGEAAIDSTNFTAVMHNVVQQGLLSQKSDGLVAQVLAALERGEKPVIALANTMGSMIEEFAGERGLEPGDAMNLNFAEVLRRYLDRSREVRIKDVTGERRVRLTEEELGEVGVGLYEEARAVIAELENHPNLPLSPIDYIKNSIEAAGYSVGEVTGRQHVLVYGGASPIYQRRGTGETTAGAKAETIRRFNSGDLDVVILNRSGSTGLSLHSSEQFSDQRTRHMLIVQPEPDINTYLQMTGRVNRTGQVNKPVYTIVSAGIPAERRVTAVLMKKMASLNANTTADRESIHSVSGLDFFNFLGDRAVAQIMSDRPDLNELMRYPVDVNESSLDNEGTDLDEFVRKVTGRIPLLPTWQQQEIYDLIESEYQSILSAERAKGRDPLSAPFLELRAQRLAQAEFLEPLSSISGSIGEGAKVELVTVNVMDKPFTQLQVVNNINAILGEPLLDELTDVSVTTLIDKGYNRSVEERKNLVVIRDQYISKQLSNFDSRIEDVEDPDKLKLLRNDRDKLKVNLQNNHRKIEGMMRAFPIGQAVQLFYNNEYHKGIVASYECRPSQYANPISPRRWKMQVLLTDGSREIKIPLAEINRPEKQRRSNDVQIAAAANSAVVFNTFDAMQKIQREDRYIVSGNILRAYQIPQLRGNLMNFSRSDGSIETGILMPRGWNYENSYDSCKVTFPDAASAYHFIDFSDSRLLFSSDQVLEICKNHLASNQFVVSLSPAPSRDKYEEIGREFSGGEGFILASDKKTMRLILNPQEAVRFVDALYDAGYPLSVPEGEEFTNMRGIARTTLGLSMPELRDEPISVENSEAITAEVAAIAADAPEWSEEEAVLSPEQALQAIESAQEDILSISKEPPATGQSRLLGEDLKGAYDRINVVAVPEQPGPLVEPPAERLEEEPQSIEAGETDRVSPEVVSPTRRELLDFYNTAHIFGLSDETKALIVRLGKAQTLGLPPEQVVDDLTVEGVAMPINLYEGLVLGRDALLCPSIESMRQWYQAAHFTAPEDKPIIRDLTEAMLAGTPEELKPLPERDSSFSNSEFRLDWQAAGQKYQTEVRFRSPSLAQLRDWSIAAQVEKDPHKSAMIANLANTMLEGTSEELKRPQDRDPGFVNPQFRLSFDQAVEMNVASVMARKHQPSKVKEESQR